MRLKKYIQMTIDLEVQNVDSFSEAPSQKQFEQWAKAALHEHDPAELLIRLVGRKESQYLNARYRNIDKATNVLSFSSDLPSELGLSILGDLVICAPLVELEAAEQGKNVQAHWAHLTVHGILHLLGYDHENDQQAEQMEALEIEILNDLGFPDPYGAQSI